MWVVLVWLLGFLFSPQIMFAGVWEFWLSVLTSSVLEPLRFIRGQLELLSSQWCAPAMCSIIHVRAVAPPSSALDCDWMAALLHSLLYLWMRTSLYCVLMRVYVCGQNDHWWHGEWHTFAGPAIYCPVPSPLPALAGIGERRKRQEVALQKKKHWEIIMAVFYVSKTT